MNKPQNTAAVDSFAALLKSIPAAFAPTARRIALKVVIDEFVDRCYEQRGPKSQFTANVGVMKLLGEINERNPIDLGYFEKYAREQVSKIYEARSQRLAARAADAFKNTPVQFTTHEYRTAVESFVAPHLGTGLGVESAQCDIGQFLLDSFAPGVEELLDGAL